MPDLTEKGSGRKTRLVNMQPISDVIKSLRHCCKVRMDPDYFFLKLWLNFVHNRHFVTGQLKPMKCVQYMFLTKTKWRRNIEIVISYRSSIQSGGKYDEHRNSREISQQQTNISKLQCYMYYEWQSIKYFYYNIC